MSQVTIHKSIQAPVELVFMTISDIRNFAEAVPDIVNVEMLTDTPTGVGTRFRETRVMYGREATEEMEITEYVENNRVRIMADSHGVVWNSLFTVQPTDAGTELSLVMEIKPQTLIARIMSFFMKGAMQKAMDKDMEAVKKHCENSAGQ